MRRLLLALLALLSATSLAQEATEAPPPALVVWLPDRLTPPDSAALASLRQQTEDFTEASGIAIELRLKRVTDVGGIMATLRSASIAAPSALPDLTLLRHQDLLSAERDGLLQSLDGLLPAALIAELGRPLALGQLDGRLYGLIYTLDVEHLAYRPQPDEDAARWDLSSLLAHSKPWAMSALYGNGLSDTFLVQYLAAGGSISADGNLIYNESAMARLLRFYEQAREQQLISPALLSLGGPADVLALLQSRQVDQAILPSYVYLAWQAQQQDDELRAAPIPTTRGEARAIVNGWAWALVASTAERQSAAMRYVIWLMDVVRQAEFSAAAFQLAALPTARQQSPALSQADKDFYQNLLETAILPITQAESGALTRAIHDALISVIDGTRSAQAALQWLNDQIDG